MNTKVVGVRIKVGTDGAESLDALATRLEDTSKLLDGDLKRDALAAADALRKLGQQQAAIDGFKQLKGEATNAAAALKAAEKEADNYGRQIAAAGPPTAANADHLKRLQIAADEARAKLSGIQSALSGATAELSRHGIAAQNVTSAQQRLDAEVTRVRASVSGLVTSHSQAAQATQKHGAATAGLQDGAAGLAGGLGLLYAKVQAVIGVTREWLDATLSLDRLRRVMTTVTGSTAEAEKQIEFLRQTAQRTGQSFTAISESYGKFVASASASGIPMSTVQQVFEGVSNAAGNLGLSSERTSMILDALGQMAGKGVVSMEELRSQLGDSLPGALSLLAKGLGLSEAQLIKLVESGNLLARDALPALGQALTTLGAKGGQVEGITASFNRFKNVILEAGTTLVDGPIGRTLGVVLISIGGVLRDITVIAVGFSEALNLVGRTIALVAAALTGNISSFKQFREEFDAIATQSGAKIQKFKDHAYAGAEGVKQLGKAAAEARPGLQAQASALDAAGTAAKSSAVAQTQAAGAFMAAGAAAATAGQATATAGHAAAASGDAVASAGTKWYSLKVAYDASADAAEKVATIAEKVVKAKDDEGKAAVALAQLTGDEQRAREATAEAATASATALREQATAQQAHVGILAAERDALIAVAKAENDFNEERKKQLGALQDTIDKLSAEAAATRESARAKELAADAARLAAETAKDNTFRYGELRLALDAARLSVMSVAEDMRKGRATAEDLDAATRKLAAAQGLLKDATLDSDARLQKWITSRQADNDVTRAGLQLRLEEAKTSERLAIAHGNEAQAMQAKITQKQIELDLARQAAKAKSDEADETIRVTEQTKAELLASGNLTPEKADELDLRIRNAQAKKLEAQAGTEATKKIEEEIAALKRLRAEKDKLATSPSLTNPDGSQKPANVLSRINGSGYQYQELDENGRTAYQRQLMSQQGGPVDNSYVFNVRDRLARGESFGAGEVDALKNALQVAQANARSITGSSVQSLAAINDSVVWVNALRSALEKAQGAAAAAATDTTNGSSSAVPSLGIPESAVPVSTPAAASTSHSVTITLPSGSSRTINTASAADGQALTEWLQKLEADMKRAGGG